MDSGASNCGDSSNVVRCATSVCRPGHAAELPVTGTDQYFTAPLGDYTLAAGVAAIGKVPTTWCNANPGVCPTTDILGNPRPNPAHPSYYDAGAYENR